MKPSERMDRIRDEDFLNELRENFDVQQFGIGSISSEAVKINCHILVSNYPYF